MNIKTTQTRETQSRLIIGFIFILLFIITANIIGMHSLYKSRSNSQEYIDAVDAAREVQVLLQKQIQTWKTTVLEGDDFDRYQNFFYRFSKYTSVIQDLLFNLKIQCITYGDISKDIENLIAQHKTVSDEYIHYLVMLEETNFGTRDEIIQQAKDKDLAILNNIDIIVPKIKNHASDMINEINRYYLIIVFIVFSVMTLSAIVLSIYLTSRIIRSQYLLEKEVSLRTSELVEANRLIKISEKKYRLIVEGSKDIIFSLDESFKFITANRAIKDHLKIKTESTTDFHFFDLIHEGINSNSFNKKLIIHQLKNLKEIDQTIEFMADLKSPSMIESIPTKIKLQYIDIEGEREFLGSAMSITQDALTESLINERRKFSIENSLIAADDISQRLTMSLNTVMSSGDVKLIRIALREIIINAIEHGNLGIRNSEKQRSLAEDNYFALINNRKQNPLYRNRKVDIEYTFDRERVFYRITDEGSGFDHAEMLVRSEDQANQEYAEHGRGISLARQIFTHIKYNQKGNQVLLVKTFDDYSS